ncbi:TetR/AcrR family transcriptional regulator [Pseudactinotalea sp.]|uniref:TetR/AcrR family transcriptional regulator n=1 Tax=Pseudactinotalea sp. TaxID=1926260 RepID=UPI003B3B14A4
MRHSVATTGILSAAAEVAAEVGFGRITMDDIARHARVAKGVLYLRFPSKDDLISATVVQEVQFAALVTLSSVRDDPRGGLLSRQFEHSIAALRSRPALQRLYRDGAASLGRSAAHEPPESRTLLGADYIVQLQRCGMVRSTLDSKALAQNLSLWTTALLARAAHLDVERLIRGMGEVVAAAVDAEPDDTTAGKKCFADLVGRVTDKEFA